MPKDDIDKDKICRHFKQTFVEEDSIFKNIYKGSHFAVYTFMNAYFKLNENPIRVRRSSFHAAWTKSTHDSHAFIRRLS